MLLENLTHQPWFCEWAGERKQCLNPVVGFAIGADINKDDKEHPLCWNHLDPDLHPLGVRLHLNDKIINPCLHATVKKVPNA